MFPLILKNLHPPLSPHFNRHPNIYRRPPLLHTTFASPPEVYISPADIAVFPILSFPSLRAPDPMVAQPGAVSRYTILVVVVAMFTPPFTFYFLPFA